MRDILRVSRIAAAVGFNEQAVTVQLIHSEDTMTEIAVMIHKGGIFADDVMVVKGLGYELSKGSC